MPAGIAQRCREGALLDPAMLRQRRALAPRQGLLHGAAGREAFLEPPGSGTGKTCKASLLHMSGGGVGSPTTRATARSTSRHGLHSGWSRRNRRQQARYRRIVSGSSDIFGWSQLRTTQRRRLNISVFNDLRSHATPLLPPKRRSLPSGTLLHNPTEVIPENHKHLLFNDLTSSSKPLGSLPTSSFVYKCTWGRRYPRLVQL